MQKAVLAREVYSRLLCLFILTFLLVGCTTNLFNHKLDEAEENLSSGKPMGDHMKVMPILAPPSVAARQTIALAVDTIISDKYDDEEAQDIRKKLSKVKKDPLLPHDLKVEAGYVLVLLERIENLKHQNKSASQQKDKCVSENERMKKELDELKYKLEKIEEIHINTEKKRGVQ